MRVASCLLTSTIILSSIRTAHSASKTWSHLRRRSDQDGLTQVTTHDAYPAVALDGSSSQVSSRIVGADNTSPDPHSRQLTCPRKPSKKLPPLPGKKGIGLTMRVPGQEGSYEENMPKVLQLQPYWNYCWCPDRPPNQPDDIEFVPMIWGYWSDKSKLLVLPCLVSSSAVRAYSLVSARFEPDLTLAVNVTHCHRSLTLHFIVLQEMLDTVADQFSAGTAKRLLGFNEPDSKLQANMSVDRAMTAWPSLQAAGYPLASPATVEGDNEWMMDFMARAEETCYDIDYVAVHWYGSANPDWFKSDMRRIYNLYGQRYPILLTEFAPADWNATTVEENTISQEKVLDFMKEVVPWLEGQEWIVGYSWFSFKQTDAVGATSALFDLEDKITSLGLYYASVSTENPRGDMSITV
jgi:Glycosyl hydrolase catalytic core